ncbi:outer membrane beta-barrel protein [Helicobacter zhangjianzhongii]|uniref:Outer membrane protein n=1 Tax=Helicobacter zhangjianzhongii TaxID=2974574 RepID=A0ACC6FRU3_9HELI|nr:MULTISPECIES: outer membrane beta-barrel protein [unclassified Helicobacter]MDL0079462.1 outer membrane protein [Helicobacter sp. CPD2-1]MDL0081637.1 outer membrane protein [Helicobacter sp. XJK30-2]
MILHALFVWNLALGSHSADFGDLDAAADSSSAPKTSEAVQGASTQAGFFRTPRILEEDNQGGFEKSAENKKVDSSNNIKAKDSRILELESGFFKPRKEIRLGRLSSGEEIHDSSPKPATAVQGEAAAGFFRKAESSTDSSKQLYFLRAQYYHHLKSQARTLENRARNGAFVGVILGASNMDITLQRLGRPYPAAINPFVLGASGGYMHFIDSAPMGIRVYGQYLAAWNSSNNIQDSITMQLFSFNLDVFGDLAITDDGYYLGAYAGVGGGLAIFDQRLENVYRNHQIIVGSVLNAGISATLAYHHRLEAGVKLPPSVINDNFAFRLMYLVSYQYLF